MGIIDVDRYLDIQKKTKTEEKQFTIKIFFNLLFELTLITCNFHIWFNTFSIFEVIIVTGFRESMRQFIKKVVFIPRWWNIVTISVVWSYHNKDNSNFLQPITCKDEKVHYVTVTVWLVKWMVKCLRCESNHLCESGVHGWTRY